MPIRPLLEGGSFSPEDVTSLANAFEEALSNLGLVNRNDPVVLMVAKRIIELAQEGERDQTRLRDMVVQWFKSVRPR
jgi:hypothetical protein